MQGVVCNKLLKEDLIRYNEKDEIELWDTETGNYRGKVHKYKQIPIKGDRPMSCHQYMMGLMSTDKNGRLIDKWHQRDYNTKKEALEENPDENNCMNCGEPLLRKKFRDAVRDHCHITGKFRGAAHNACNLKLRINPKTAIIPGQWFSTTSGVMTPTTSCRRLEKSIPN